VPPLILARTSGSYRHQARLRRVIYVLGDTSVLYAVDHFVHNKKRNKEPLAWSDGVAEAILYFDIQLRGFEYAMNYVLQFSSVDVVELISGDDFDICHQKGRIYVSRRDARLDLTCAPQEVRAHIKGGNFRERR